MPLMKKKSKQRAARTHSETRNLQRSKSLGQVLPTPTETRQSIAVSGAGGSGEASDISGQPATRQRLGKQRRIVRWLWRRLGSMKLP
jgi:hypothetical protein